MVALSRIFLGMMALINRVSGYGCFAVTKN